MANLVTPLAEYSGYCWRCAKYTVTWFLMTGCTEMEHWETYWCSQCLLEITEHNAISGCGHKALEWTYYDPIFRKWVKSW